MDEEFDVLADVPRGSKVRSGSGEGPGFSTADIIAHAEDFLVGEFLAGRSPSPRDVVAGVPALAGAYKSTNAVGTALGNGVGGHGIGLGLHRHGHQFAACAENLLLVAVAARKQGRLDALLGRHGFATVADFAAAAKLKLPSIVTA
jgi:hypothetical protein